MIRNEKMDLRDRIINAAAKEISEKGFFRASTRTISKEAKTSDSAMYYVFKSKEEILAGIIEKGWGDILIRLRKNLLGVSDPVEMMKIVFTTVAGYLMSERPEIGIVMLIDGRKEWGIEEKLVTAEQAEFFDIMEKIIQQGQKMGVFNKGFNIEAARQALFGAGEGLVLGLYLKTKTDYRANYSFEETV
ncbi:MAG: TetR/AcrR family transcriptional regulator, partial [bacterium]